jgi:HD superfamily phosphohydrolase YqeK
MRFSLKTWESLLKEKAYPFLIKGRLEDWDHTLRAVEFGKILAEEEGGDPEIVLTALTLHDIGWSQVDYGDFLISPIFEKQNTQSVQDHMIQGANLAGQILNDLQYPPDKKELVLRIIAHHDRPEAIGSMPEIEATLVFEADRLDRFRVESLERYRKMFGPDYGKKGLEFLLQGAKIWFQTSTGKRMVRELLDSDRSSKKDSPKEK